MSVQDESLNPLILESARGIFYEKGFQKATLREIAKKANVATGAIYRRYKSKDELFEAVVSPGILKFETRLNNIISGYNEKKKNFSIGENIAVSEEKLILWIDMLYEDYETFKILFTKAEGSVFSNYIYEFCEDNARISYAFLEDLRDMGQIHLRMNYKEYHALVISYWSAIFEVVIFDFTYEEAVKFVEKVNKFYRWEAMLEYIE